MPAEESEEGMPAKVRELVKWLGYGTLASRSDAAKALGKIKHASAVPHLVKALEDKQWGENWVFRRQAAIALGEIGHESAVPHLLKELHDRTIGVEAVLALGKIGRAIQGKKVEGREVEALQMVGAHLRENDSAAVIEKACEAALKGKVTKKNARLFIKQLRAVKGNLK